MRDFISAQLGATDLDGKSVCLVIPDDTRSCPLAMLVKAVHGALHGRVSRLTALVALGTHKAMTEEALGAMLGFEPGRMEETYPGLRLLNHEWWDPSTFVDLGTIPAARIEELSEGRLSLDVPVLLNKEVVEHDVAIVVGPVLPHEVVGISGGNKYFFPGVAGQQIIDVSHWLGALITSAEIIGTTGLTPVRALINAGAALVSRIAKGHGRAVTLVSHAQETRPAPPARYSTTTPIPSPGAASSTASRSTTTRMGTARPPPAGAACPPARAGTSAPRRARPATAPRCASCRRGRSGGRSS